MNFVNAVKKMKQGKRVKRKHWLKHDYLFIQESKILCDGGYEYQDKLKVGDFTATDWIVTEEV
jgi:hypothetical protein